MTFDPAILNSELSREVIDLLSDPAKVAVISNAYETLRPEIAKISMEMVTLNNSKDAGVMLLGVKHLLFVLSLFSLQRAHLLKQSK